MQSKKNKITLLMTLFFLLLIVGTLHLFSSEKQGDRNEEKSRACPCHNRASPTQLVYPDRLSSIDTGSLNLQERSNEKTPVSLFPKAASTPSKVTEYEGRVERGVYSKTGKLLWREAKNSVEEARPGSGPNQGIYYPNGKRRDEYTHDE